MSRVARYSSIWASSAALLVAAAGCGGSDWKPQFKSTGAGKDQYWVVQPQGKPKAVVVLLHGLGQDSGEQLEPWQAHLADEGYAVIYPRYESPPPDPQARNNIVGAVGRALGDLGRPDVPLVLLGHSRGGRLAVEAAAFLNPRLVVAMFPGQINPAFEPATNLKLIPKTTDIYLFVGDRDKSVGNTGALELDHRRDVREDRRRRAEPDDGLHDRQAEDQGRHGRGHEAPETVQLGSTPSIRRSTRSQIARLPASESV